MATAGQHVQLPAFSKYGDGQFKDYSQMNSDGTGIRYRDDYVIVPTDSSSSLWSVKDVFGREVLGGRFTSIKLAKEYTDKHIDKLNRLKEKEQLERDERERTEFRAN